MTRPMSSNAQQRAKRPGSALAGPYGHPLHAAVVPVPVGAFLVTFVLDVASRSSTEYGAGYARAATVVLGVGLIGAVVAAVLGLMDYAQIARHTVANRVATTHLVLNFAVVLALGGSFLGRLGSDAPKVPAGQVWLTGIALAVLAVSGWLGGRLAYRYGVRVADERTQADGWTDRGGLLPPEVSGAGRVDRIPGTNVPVEEDVRR